MLVNLSCYLHNKVKAGLAGGALLALKRGLRERLLACRGWDVVAHTRAMEAAFEQMVAP